MSAATPSVTRSGNEFRGDPADIFLARDLITSDDREIARTYLRFILQRKRPAFFNRAKCKGSPLDFTSPNPKTVSACLQLCGQCDVRQQCRDYADELEDRVAVMGGEDPRARRARWALARKRERAA
jgi:hypothetical protein